MNDPVLNKLLSEITNKKHVGGMINVVANQEEREGEEKKERLLSPKYDAMIDKAIRNASNSKNVRFREFGRGLEQLKQLKNKAEANEDVQKFLNSVGGISGLLIILRIINFFI